MPCQLVDLLGVTIIIILMSTLALVALLAEAIEVCALGPDAFAARLAQDSTVSAWLAIVTATLPPVGMAV